MKLTFFFFLVIPVFCFSQLTEQDQLEIREVMHQQELAWNNGDIDEFMEGYLKSENLRFTSSGRTSMGWQSTLDNYKKAYPTREIMGELKFEIFDIYPVTNESAALTGSFYLSRDGNDASGTFNLIWKKVNGKWKIISDMTCSD